MLGAVAIAVAVIIVISTSSSSSSNNTQAGYRAKLTAALAPLIAANQSLSNSLQALDGSKTTVSAAQRTTVLTQQALVSTRGAVGVLAAPNSDSTLSQQVQQALTDENGYLQAVSSTLGNPGTSTQVRALVRIKRLVGSTESHLPSRALASMFTGVLVARFAEVPGT